MNDAKVIPLVARELPDSMDIASDSPAIAILTLAVSLQMPPKSDLTPEDAAKDILQVYRAVRKIFLTAPQKRH